MYRKSIKSKKVNKINIAKSDSRNQYGKMKISGNIRRNFLPFTGCIVLTWMLLNWSCSRMNTDDNIPILKSSRVQLKWENTDSGRSLVLFYSLDGLDWKLAKYPLVSTLNIEWEDGTIQKLEALDRPQLYTENGKPVALLAAVNETLDHSYNVQIPLINKSFS